MRIPLVLTVLTKDRPGVVEALAKVLSDHDAGWLDSNMARLAGQFAGILSVDVPEERAGRLRTALQALEGEGMQIELVTPEPGEPEPTRDAHLRLMGTDRVGIVRDIGQVLASLAVNVESLETEVVPGSMSSHPVFKAEAALQLPVDLDVDRLRDRLEAIALDLMVELSLEALDA